MYLGVYRYCSSKQLEYVNLDTVTYYVKCLEEEKDGLFVQKGVEANLQIR